MATRGPGSPVDSRPRLRNRGRAEPSAPRSGLAGAASAGRSGRQRGKPGGRRHGEDTAGGLDRGRTPSPWTPSGVGEPRLRSPRSRAGRGGVRRPLRAGHRRARRRRAHAARRQGAGGARPGGPRSGPRRLARPLRFRCRSDRVGRWVPAPSAGARHRHRVLRRRPRLRQRPGLATGSASRAGPRPLPGRRDRRRRRAPPGDRRGAPRSLRPGGVPFRDAARPPMPSSSSTGASARLRRVWRGSRSG